MSLSATSRKRQRGKSPREESSCRIDLSVWTSAVGSDGSNSRSFRRVNLFQCTIPKWGAPTRVLGVFRAFDDQSGVDYSWVVASLTKRDGKHGIALLQCTEDALSLVKVIAVRSNPEQVVVLRGPVVLYATPSFVSLAGKDGDIALDQDFDIDRSHISPARYLVCTTEHDLEGVVACLEPQEPTADALRVCTIFADGKSQREWILRDVDGVSLRNISVSTQRGMAALAQADGTIHLFHLQFGKCLWTVRGTKDIGSPRSIIFHRHMVVCSLQNPNTLWAVPLYAPKGENQKVRSPAKLFPDQFKAASPKEYNYFLALWRDSVLLCNDANGSCCADYDFSSAATERDESRLQSEHYLRTVVKNLETRLDFGVQRVTDVAERQDDKVRMVEHIRGLLIAASGGKLKPTPELFGGQVEELLSSPEQRAPMRDVSDNEADDPPPSEKITVNGCSVPNHISPIARIVRISAGVDKSAHFIVVRAYIAVLGPSDEEGSVSSDTTLQLNVSFDRCMPAIWDVEQRRNLRKGDKCWLQACAPVSIVAANSASSLDDISLVVRIDTTDGPSQHIASYSLTDVLSSPADTTEEQDTDSLLSFEQKVHAVAQGREAHDLNRFTMLMDLCRGLTVKTRENLAYFNFKITSVTELALAVAKLRAVIDDNVRLRSASELSQSTFHAADVSLRALEAEIQATRDIVQSRQTVGYNAENLRTLLRVQMEMDDCIGKVEEQNLGT